MINEKFNVDFKTEFVPIAEYFQKLPSRMASGDIPDIIGMESADSNYYKWAKQGAFLPLDSSLINILRSRWYRIMYGTP
jgi:putative aldouronate transport system substrate-binding protein